MSSRPAESWLIQRVNFPRIERYDAPFTQNVYSEFRDLPYPILRQALIFLSKSGRAQIFKGTTEDGDGVKFF